MSHGWPTWPSATFNSQVAGAFTLNRPHRPPSRCSRLGYGGTRPPLHRFSAVRLANKPSSGLFTVASENIEGFPPRQFFSQNKRRSLLLAFTCDEGWGVSPHQASGGVKSRESRSPSPRIPEVPPDLPSSGLFTVTCAKAEAGAAGKFFFLDQPSSDLVSVTCEKAGRGPSRSRLPKQAIK
jgi:hypothetical protein